MSTNVTEQSVHTTEPLFLTTEEFATLVRRSPHTVRYWRKIGYGPRGIRMGRPVLYRVTDVDAWFAQLGAEQGGGSHAA